MSIPTVTAQCPKCRAHLKIKVDALLERQVKCPRCGVVLRRGNIRSERTLPAWLKSPMVLFSAASVVLVLLVGGVTFRLLQPDTPPAPAPVAPADATGGIQTLAQTGLADDQPAESNTPDTGTADPAVQSADHPTTTGDEPTASSDDLPGTSRGSSNGHQWAQPAYGERYALLVGVKHYSRNSGLRPLQHPERDVDELAEVLEASGIRPENIVVMSQSRGVDDPRYLPTKARILGELENLLRDRTAGDTVMVAFAGHGAQFRGSEESYFCPLDARIRNVSTLISFKQIYDELARSEAGFKLLISDACRDDPLSSSARRAVIDLESESRPQELPAPGGVAALFGCSAGEVAFEHEKLKHGVFFHFVIQALRGEADLDADSEVTLPELEFYTKKRVSDFVRSEFDGVRQMPHLVNNSRGLIPLVQVSLPTDAPDGTTIADASTPDSPGSGNLPDGLPGSPGDVPSTPDGGTPPELPPANTGDGPPPPPRTLSMAEKNALPPGDYPPEVEVPQVTGQTLGAARQLLHQNGLIPELTTEFAQDGDLVRSQLLVAGKVVPSRTVVRLGRIMGRVPNVVGMPFAEAAELLRNQEGFRVHYDTSLPPEMPVTHQDPKAGGLLQRGLQVDLTNMVKMPEVEGLPIEEAARNLAEVGLQPSSRGALAGDRVFSQFPKGNRLVARGQTARLTPGVPAPNLLGNYAAAEAALKRLSLRGSIVSTRNVFTSDPLIASAAPTVEWQSVRPGVLVSRQTGIGVKVIRSVYVPPSQNRSNP